MLILRDNTKFKVRSGPSDIQVIIELYVGKTYHSHLGKLNEESIIIDVGANIGIFSIFICKYLHKHVNIYSFEPFPENFKLLKENIKLNELENNIQIYPMAIGQFNEERLLNVDEKDNAMHSFFTNGSAAIPVKTITLEKIFEMNKLKNCDFLKIDCEGSEYEIILNTPNELLRSIRIIGLEFHDVQGYRYSQISDKLKKNGFAIDVRENEVKEYGFIDAIRIDE